MYPTLRRSGSQRLIQHPVFNQTLTRYRKLTVTFLKRLRRHPQPLCQIFHTADIIGRISLSLLPIDQTRAGQLTRKGRPPFGRSRLGRRQICSFRLDFRPHSLLFARFRPLPRLFRTHRLRRRTDMRVQILLRLTAEERMIFPARQLDRTARLHRLGNFFRRTGYLFSHLRRTARLHQRVRIHINTGRIAITLIDKLGLHIMGWHPLYSLYAE